MLEQDMRKQNLKLILKRAQLKERRDRTRCSVYLSSTLLEEVRNSYPEISVSRLIEEFFRELISNGAA